MAAKRSPDIVPGARARLNAETSLEPDGLTRRVVLNIMEAFFRRPWLFLLPLVLMTGLGVASVIGTTKEYRSVGTINASANTLLADLTEAAPPGGFTFESPAALTSRNIGELLSTQVFLREVAQEVGLDPATIDNPALLGDIASSTTATANGDFLVRVASTTPDPQLSARLAMATIDSYIAWVINDDLSESQAAEAFFENQVASAEQAVADARAERDLYLTETGTSSLTDVPLATQLEVERRNAIIARAEEQYTAALDKLEEARLATEQAQTVVEQRLRVVDAPEVPAAPEPQLKKMVIAIAMFAAIGLILSGAMVVLAATLDGTIRIPNDITAKFGLEVLAVVPDTRR